MHPTNEDAYVVEQDLFQFDGRPEVRAETKFCDCGSSWKRFRAINFYPHANQYGLESPPKFSKWIKWS